MYDKGASMKQTMHGSCRSLHQGGHLKPDLIFQDSHSARLINMLHLTGVSRHTSIQRDNSCHQGRQIMHASCCVKLLSAKDGMADVITS